ncbi:MAG: DUF3969 family protein [Planctomycetes bacterium]|nr:DUF3969 family protein [Planctomycetota bacterium]
MRPAPLQVNMIADLTRRGLPQALLERRLAQAGLGVLRALRGASMAIEDAENDLFNLATYQAARRRRLDRCLIEFLEWGMELDDVLRLAPEGLEESFRSMENLLLKVISRSLGKSRRRKRA